MNLIFRTEIRLLYFFKKRKIMKLYLKNYNLYFIRILKIKNLLKYLINKKNLKI